MAHFVYFYLRLMHVEMVYCYFEGRSFPAPGMTCLISGKNIEKKRVQKTKSARWSDKMLDVSTILNEIEKGMRSLNAFAQLQHSEGHRVKVTRSKLLVHHMQQVGKLCPVHV